MLTDSGAVEGSRQDEEDVVGPVLPVVRHLVLFDHQNVQVVGALHGVEDVEQAMLLASSGRGEDGTLYACWVLERRARRISNKYTSIYTNNL